MKIYTGKEIFNQEGLAATIGFFDGVHPGHLHIIQQVLEVAKANHLLSAVITFRDHPRKVVNPSFIPNLLTTLEERIALFQTTGIDICIVLDFDQEMANYTAKMFIEKVLYKQLSVQKLIIGYDHRFGKDRAEGYEQYVEYTQQLGMEAIEAKLLQVEDTAVSSSAIRRQLNEGNVSWAAKLLQRNYSITGKVVYGKQLGRTIGYPTANIELFNNEKLIPKNGVYAVKINWKNDFYNGMLNIGTNPTVNDTNEIHIEVNIFDFDENLYGEILDIEFIQRIRDERKMNGLSDLTAQLYNDKIDAIKILS